MSTRLLSNPPSWLQQDVPLITAESTTSSQPAAVNDILAWLQQLKPDFISTRQWLECQTVIIEGLDNVIQHAHHHLPATTPIKINLNIYSQGIAIKIWDLGEPFDLQQALTETPERQDESADHGRGLILMRRILDYVSYEPLPEGGNCLSMVKSF
jgi:serine/threonine-protein kinase RsbW